MSIPALSAAADPAPVNASIDHLEGSDKVSALIDRVVERQHALKSLRADFVQLKKRLSLLEIEVDRELFLPVVITYNEADGDSTRYEFRNLVVDTDIDDSRFQLDLGADVLLETIDASVGDG